MGTLNANDKIFATVSYAGRTILNTSFTGVTTLTEILELIRQSLDGFIGFVRLKLRNSSQGWSRIQGLRIAPSNERYHTSFPEATQLTLF